MVGQTLGGYRLVAQLGQGGMGAVYLAEHLRIERRAAVKVLLPQFSQDAGVVSRFFTEALATSRIRHPGIVEIFDCDVQADGRAYIVMEYLEGESLAARLSRTRPIPEAEAREIIRQIASALAAAHAKSIAHRDLKPDNVFLALDPEQPGRPVVKILDFGIAKLFGSTLVSENRTRTGSILGTPVYMSPEQCKGAGQVDHRTDIYSLGCILFEMLAGRPPFVHAGMGETIAAHIHQAPPRLADLAPGVTPELDGLVARLLAKDPAARPQTMAEIANTLAGTLEGSAPGGTAPTPVARTLQLPPQRGQTERLPIQSTTFSRATGEMGAKNSNETGNGNGGRELHERPRSRRGALVIAGTAAAMVVGAILWTTGRPGKIEQAATPPVTAPPVAAGSSLPPAEIAPPPMVTVRVTNPPPGLTVTVDGAPGALPLRLPRDQQNHRLLFAAPGFETEEQVVDGSRDRDIELHLRPVARVGGLQSADEVVNPPARREQPVRPRNKGTAKRPTIKRQTDGIIDL